MTGLKSQKITGTPVMPLLTQGLKCRVSYDENVNHALAPEKLLEHKQATAFC